jgi:hypothetical protein
MREHRLQKNAATPARRNEDVTAIYLTYIKQLQKYEIAKEFTH